MNNLSTENFKLILFRVAIWTYFRPNSSNLAVFRSCWPSKIDLAEEVKVGRILAANRKPQKYKENENICTENIQLVVKIILNVQMTNQETE